MTLRTILSLVATPLLLLVPAACSSGPGPAPAGTSAGDGGASSSQDGGGEAGPTPQGATTEGVTLTAKSSAQESSVGQVSPPSGQLFVAVDLVLQNGTAAAIPLLTPLFAITTSSGLQYPGSAETALAPGGCDATASLTPGHSVECTVLFAAPASAVADHVSYRLIDGKVVTAPLSTRQCSVCNGTCVDLQTDPQNCGACGVVVQNGTCVGGKTSCGGGQQSCGGVCVDTQNDTANCGACGHACPQNCMQGKCAVQKTSSTAESCNTLCGGLGCLTADANYQDLSNTCSSGEFPLSSCSEVPPATQSAQGCTYSFQELVCNCG